MSPPLTLSRSTSPDGPQISRSDERKSDSRKDLSGRRTQERRQVSTPSERWFMWTTSKDGDGSTPFPCLVRVTGSNGLLPRR